MGVQVGATVAADAVSAGDAVAAGGIAGGSPDVSRAISGDPTSYFIDSSRKAAAAPREAASAGTDSPAALPAQPTTPTPALPDASAEAMNVDAARILYSAASGPSALGRPALSRPGRAAHRHDAAAVEGPRSPHPSSDLGA